MVDSIPRAADLMRSVDMPECGLVVDYWHVFRHGTTHDELAQKLTVDQIFGVELNDADAEVQGTLFEDTRDHDGFAVKETRTSPASSGLCKPWFQGPWGVEILSDAHRALPVREALQLAYSTALTCFPA
jgi:sugar phosphate isomerase/epimerase